MASRSGDVPTGILVVTWLVAESITVTEFETVVVTKSCGAALPKEWFDDLILSALSAASTSFCPRAIGEISIATTVSTFVILVSLLIVPVLVVSWRR